MGSARQTLLWFLDEGLQLPVRRIDGEMIWKRPTYGAVYRLLTHPAYGGAYAYGKTEYTYRYEDGHPRGGIRRKPRDKWLALIPEAHEGYISWEEFERIQETVSGNSYRADGPGAPKRGAALLTGLLRCRRCGRKLTVRYTGRDKDMLRYCCHRGWLDNGEPRCIAFGGVPVDEAIGREIMRVVEPGAVEAAVLANQQESAQRDEVLEALKRDLEAARYAANRSWKQYDAADPENRLVADELEHRWNQALERVRELELRIESHQGRGKMEEPATVEEFTKLAEDLDVVWNGAEVDVRLKKRIVRTLIQEVVADVDSQAGEIILSVHWRGGVHTELRLQRRRRGHCNPTSKDTVEAVRILARICNDKMIAGVLNRNGLRTGIGNRWTKQRVTSLRSYHKIQCYCPEKRNAEGWMNLTEAARYLGISTRTLRLAVERGEINGEHPLADGPWLFKRCDLETEDVSKLVERARGNKSTPAVPSSEQNCFDFSST